MTMNDLVTLALCAGAVLLVACGPNALAPHVAVAGAMHDVQVESGPAIRAARREAMVVAARAVHDEGVTLEAAHAAREHAGTEWQCVVDGHRGVTAAVVTYIEAIVLWNAGRELRIDDGIALARRVLDAYRVTASCTASRGWAGLPAVPAFLSFMPSAWDMGDRPQ